MALIQRAPSRKKQIQLAGTLVFVIGTTLTVMYFGLIRKPAYVPLPEDGETFLLAPGEAAIPRTSGIDALDSLNGDPTFSGLKTYGSFPIPIQPRGRKQPFVSPEE